MNLPSIERIKQKHGVTATNREPIARQISPDDIRQRIQLEHYADTWKDLIQPEYTKEGNSKNFFHIKGTEPEGFFKKSKKHNLDIPDASIYDASKDANGYWRQIKKHGFFGDEAKHHFERILRDNGFDGYRLPHLNGTLGNTVVIFHPVKLAPNGSAALVRNTSKSLHDARTDDLIKNTSSDIPKNKLFIFKGLANVVNPSEPLPETPSLPHEEIIHHPNFLNWFGNWKTNPQNASKVVHPDNGQPLPTHAVEPPLKDNHSKVIDEQGNPLVMYHGSPRGGYRNFDFEKLNPDSLYGRGAYFTENPEIANEYADSSNRNGVPLVSHDIPPLNVEDVHNFVDDWYKNKGIDRKEIKDFWNDYIQTRSKKDDWNFKQHEEYKDFLRDLLKENGNPVADEHFDSLREGHYPGGGGRDELSLAIRKLSPELRKKKQEFEENQDLDNYENNDNLFNGMNQKYQSLAKRINPHFNLLDDSGLFDAEGNLYNLKNHLEDYESLYDPHTRDTSKLQRELKQHLDSFGYHPKDSPDRSIFDDFLENKVKFHQPEVKSAYLNIRNPLDMDKKLPEQQREDISRKIGEKIGRDNFQFKGKTGQDLWDWLLEQDFHPDEIHDIFKDAGIDGITHIGGGRWGNPTGHSRQHRVWIALHPTQIKHTHNNLEFNPESEDIYKAVPEPEPEPLPMEPKLSHSEIIKHPNFVNWFGDWKKSPQTSSKVVNPSTTEPMPTVAVNAPDALNHSKVLDSEGKPLVLYHGSPRGGFRSFEFDKLTPNSLFGRGAYFTENPNIAEEYSNSTHRNGVNLIDSDIGDINDEELSQHLKDYYDKHGIKEDDYTKFGKIIQKSQNLHSMVTDELRPAMKMKSLNGIIDEYNLKDNPLVNDMQAKTDYVLNKSTPKAVQLSDILNRVTNYGVTNRIRQETQKELSQHHDKVDLQIAKDLQPFASKLGVDLLKDSKGGTDVNKVGDNIEAFIHQIHHEDFYVRNMLKNRTPYIIKDTLQDYIDKDEKPLAGGHSLFNHLKERYQKNRFNPEIKNVYLNIRKPLDMDKPVPEDVRKVINEEAPKLIKHKDEFDDFYDTTARDAADLYGEEIPDFHIEEGDKGEDVWNKLRHEEGLHPDEIHDIFKKAGIDGITHLGGGRWGNPSSRNNNTHRVWIALHPTQIKHIHNNLDFNPEEHDMYKSVQRKVFVFNNLKPRKKFFLFKGVQKAIARTRVAFTPKDKNSLPSYKIITQGNRSQNGIAPVGGAVNVTNINPGKKEGFEVGDTKKVANAGFNKVKFGFRGLSNLDEQKITQQYNKPTLTIGNTSYSSNPNYIKPIQQPMEPQSNQLIPKINNVPQRSVAPPLIVQNKPNPVSPTNVVNPTPTVLPQSPTLPVNNQPSLKWDYKTIKNILMAEGLNPNSYRKELRRFVDEKTPHDDIINWARQIQGF